MGVAEMLQRSHLPLNRSNLGIASGESSPVHALRSTPPSPPIPKPRVICYHQSYYGRDNQYVSILPLLTQRTGVTHIILAAIHVNDGPGNVLLNDDPFTSPKYDILWREVRTLQAAGIQFLGMLGGWARGTYERLDGDAAAFEAYYTPLRDIVRKHALDGLDLDVEEDMSLSGVVRLIDRLHADFGEGFLVTLAPVAAALLDLEHLSGFDYKALEVARGARIAWYNTQFYCGWGSAEETSTYEAIVRNGWDPARVVFGVCTNPTNASGWVQTEVFQEVIATLRTRYTSFAGVMGWEYFNSLPGDVEEPWQWASCMRQTMDNCVPSDPFGRHVVHKRSRSLVEL